MIDHRIVTVMLATRPKLTKASNKEYLLPDRAIAQAVVNRKFEEIAKAPLLGDAITPF